MISSICTSQHSHQQWRSVTLGLHPHQHHLSYFIGYLEFLKLRDQAKETLGEQFSIQEFHNFILTIGPAPFNIIEEEMEEWMK